MDDKQAIGGQMLMQMILAAVDKLNAEKGSIDSLNVFPVPDGDTGTNMSLTLNSAGRFIGKLAEEQVSVSEVAKQMAHGALMGARGNSGVILSQILGGFAAALTDKETVDSASLAAGFAGGVESAYKAVAKPMEGTILTVAREASAYLTEQLTAETTLEECLRLYLEEGYRSLARTPEILPVLKQAGVVDAGAKGLLVIVEGMLSALLGEAVAAPRIEEKVVEPMVDDHFFVDPDSIQFQYCTELIIKNKPGLTVDIDQTKQYLEQLGDSLLVVGTGEVTKIHVHTNHPGQVLEHGLTLGDLNDVKIENMKAQTQRNFAQMPEKEIAVIAVSAGEGLNEIFKSMGVDMIISGGQTMNPSTEEFLEAINKVHAKNVILLPNNKNIILTAEQAGKVEEHSQVYVVPTRTIPQGIAALMEYNIELTAQENADRMSEATSAVISGEITHAVRDTSIGETEIKEGQLLGIVDGKIAAVGDEMNALVKDTLQAMQAADYELVTLYYGEDIKAQEAEDLLSDLEEQYPDLDFELHDGAQSVYFYLISVE